MRASSYILSGIVYAKEKIGVCFIIIIHSRFMTVNKGRPLI